MKSRAKISSTEKELHGKHAKGIIHPITWIFFQQRSKDKQLLIAKNPVHVQESYGEAELHLPAGHRLDLARK